MKYENFQQAKALVEQIDNHKQLVEKLSSKQASVIINENEHQGRIMTIGAGPSYEHEYQPFAAHFVGSIIEDLLKRIDQAKAKLETL